MDVWLGVLGFVLFLGFGTAVLVCISAIKRQTSIIIKSRLHHRLNNSEIIYANLGLVGFGVLLFFHYYIFLPAVLAFVLFIILSSRIQSGLTRDGALIGTTFVDWEFMKSYKLIHEDVNRVTLKIRANRRQYVLVCDRSSYKEIEELFRANNVKQTETAAGGK